MGRMLLLLWSAAVFGQAVSVPVGTGSNPNVTIEARLLLSPAAIKSAVGIDPGQNVVMVEVKMIPAPGKTVDISWDHFLLRSDSDGQKCTAYHPSQIAGSSVLVVKSVGGTQGAAASERRNVPFGIPGIPGTSGRPSTLPGTGTPQMGSATADNSTAAASLEENPDKQANPLLAALKEKVLAEGPLSEPRQGLLYFVMEGKLKVKNLELMYGRSEPKVSVRFKEPKK